MQRSMALLLLTTVVASAQISNLVVDADGPCVRVSFQTDGGGENFWFDYGLDPDPSDEFRTEVLFGSASANTRTTMTCDLPPATKVYISPGTASSQFACSSVCTNCDFGKGPTDASCDAVGEPVNVTTDAFSGVEPPATPVHAFDPDAFCTGPPDTVRTVTCEDGVAVDFMSILNQAAADDTDQCHLIEIPAGCTVKRAVVFPARNGPGSGTGGIVFRSAGDNRLFPPAGVRVDPSYRATLARFEAPKGRSYLGRNALISPFRMNAGADGYRFERVSFGYPRDPSEAYQQHRVLGVAQSVPGGTVTIQIEAGGGSISFFDKVVLDLRGCSGLQGVKNVLTPSAASFSIGAGYQITGACTGGTATFFESIDVAKVRNSTPVVIETAVHHGMPNLESLAIVSITDNLDGTSRLNLAQPQHRPFGFGARYIRGNDVVMVSGSGTTLDGQLIKASGGSSVSVTVPGSVSCAANCGTVREFHTIQVEGTGLSCADGSRHFRVVDASSIELLNTAGCGESVRRGRFAYDPAMVFNLIGARNGISRLAFDQVLFDCGGFPNRTSRCIDLSRSERIAIKNSFVSGNSFWMPVDPISGEFRDTIQDGFIATATTFALQGFLDGVFENNAIAATHGIVIFNDEDARQSRDWTLRRNVVYMPYRYLSGHPESDGRYYPNRHCLEVKSAERLLVDGLWCSGNWADWTPLGYAIAISPRGRPGAGNLGSVHHARDILIRGAYLERVASGIQLAHESRPQHIVGPTIRVAVTDSLISGLDYVTHQSIPSGTGGVGPPDNFGGVLAALYNGLAHFDFSRNTLGSQRGRGVPLFDIRHFASSTWKVDDNILSFSRNTTGVFGIFANSFEVDFTPGCMGLSGPALWDCFVRRISAGGSTIPDPLSSVSGNVIVGGIENAQRTSDAQWLLDRASSSDSITVTDSEAAAYFSGWGDDDHLYPAAPSWNDRIEATFESAGPGLTGWEPKAPYAGKGVEMRKLKGYLGLISDVTLTEVSPTSVRISYPAAEDEDFNPEPCFVDYSLDPTFSDGWWSTGDRIDDGGAVGTRQIDLTGLAPGAIYFWRLSCPASQARGEIRMQ